MPKPKKKTPQEINDMFMEWENGEEKKLIDELNKKPEPVQDTSPDLIKKWGDYIVQFYKIGPVFKIKNVKMKPIDQTQLRTIFFASTSGTDADKGKEEPFEIDGVTYDYKFKEDPKNAWNARRAFCSILRCIDDDIKVFDGTNFVDEYGKWKKNKLVPFYKNFIKFMKIHLKKVLRQGETKKTSGFMETEKILDSILLNIKNLLEANMHLTMFEFENKTELLRATNDFKYRALLKNFYKTYKICQNTMYTYGFVSIEKKGDKDDRVPALKHNPDLKHVLKKFDYDNWRLNHIEHFFINPLHSTYLRMRANLVKLYTMGRDFWRYPIDENLVFKKDMMELVDREMLAESVLGNELKRDQLNFAYKALEYLYLNLKIPNGGEIKNFLLDKDTKAIPERVIPNVIIFRTLCQMADIAEKKYQDSKKPKESRTKVFTKKVNPAISKAIDIVTEGDPAPIISEEEKIRIEKLNEEVKMYGRYELWPDYIDANHYNMLKEGSEIMRKVNVAVRKDFEDYLIMKGLFPTSSDITSDKKGKDKAHEITKSLSQLVEEDNKKNSKSMRPPNIWNHPKALLEGEVERNFRPASDPKESYVDERIEKLETIVEKVGKHIIVYKQENWNTLIKHIIDFFIVADHNSTNLAQPPLLDLEEENAMQTEEQYQ